MKKFLIGLALVLATSSANANFFGGNDGEWKMGPNGPYWDESDWPEWTPMYWMEEFMDSFDDNDSFGFGGSNNRFMPGGFGGGGYPQQIPQPYGVTPAPYGYGYGMPQQAPVAPIAPAMPK
jgi:hypothetical protein